MNLVKGYPLFPRKYRVRYVLRPHDKKKPFRRQIGIQSSIRAKPLGIFALPSGVAATAIAVPTIAYVNGTSKVVIPEANLKVYFRI